MNRSPELKIENILPIRLGSNVFIGLGSIILPGAEIGSNIIVGAGSVVAGRLDEGFVYAGSPARRVRTLDEHIERLSEKDFLWDSMKPGQSKKEFLSEHFRSRHR